MFDRFFSFDLEENVAQGSTIQALTLGAWKWIYLAGGYWYCTPVGWMKHLDVNENWRVS